MRDPERTRATILSHSGSLFNTQGYRATSLSDITKATGYTKGAIYRHFENKKALEEEAFDVMTREVLRALRARIKQESTAPAKLRAIIRFFETYVTHPVVQGGCPIMNTAVEADDAHPNLREKAQHTLALVQDSLRQILKNGKKFEQLKPETDVDHYSSLFIALLEGAIMMSRLRGNDIDMKHAVSHLNDVVDQLEL